MKPVLKPKRLKKGDTIAVVSPSWGGAHKYPQPVEWGIRQIRERLG